MLRNIQQWEKKTFFFTGQGTRDQAVVHTISVDLKYAGETKKELAVGYFESCELFMYFIDGKSLLYSSNIWNKFVLYNVLF